MPAANNLSPASKALPGAACASRLSTSASLEMAREPMPRVFTSPACSMSESSIRASGCESGRTNGSARRSSSLGSEISPAPSLETAAMSGATLFAA